MLTSLCLVAVCHLASGTDIPEMPVWYTSKTPYPEPLYTVYPEPPAGFSLINIQHVARHGSRGLSSRDADDLLMQVWLQAQYEQALTPLGLQLGADVMEILRIHHDIGYGQLSGLGRTEHKAQAARLLERIVDASALEDLEREIHVIHSGRSRAIDSGTAFIDGWLTMRPQDKSRFLEPVADEHTVYFHSAEGSEGYADYRRGERVQQVLSYYESLEQTEDVARAIVEALFTQDFIQRLDGGAYRFVALDDDSDVIESSFDVAMAVYDLFSIAINLTEEDAPDFLAYVPEETRMWLAFIDDADSFYGRGPGFADETISFELAGNLVSDMLARTNAVAQGESTEFATVRFTHAQALMPIAAWLEFPDAHQGADPAVPFSYENNLWRAARVAPMASNVQWDVFQNGDGEVLVRVLWNERIAPLGRGCEAYFEGFYRLEELNRCLGS